MSCLASLWVNTTWQPEPLTRQLSLLTTPMMLEALVLESTSDTRAEQKQQILILIVVLRVLQPNSMFRGY
jgi:hypothetical protein